MPPIASSWLIALAVLALDLSVGPLRPRLPLPPGPPAAIARAALALSRRLDRPNRGSRALRIRGALLVVVLVGFSALTGIALQIAVQKLPAPYGSGLEAAMLWACIRVSRPLGRLRNGARRMAREPDPAAYGRKILQQTAISFVHFVIAPLFWYLAAGLPGLLIAASGWALQRAAGERADSRAFGLAAIRLERILAWIQSRLAELVLALAAVVAPRGRPSAALLEGWKNAGSGDLGPVAAFAGGLGLAVPALPGGTAPNWVGGGTARVERQDLLRAIWLYTVALIIVGIVLATLSFAQLQ